MLRTDTFWFLQSSQYCLEKKATASYAKHWYFFTFHSRDPIFLDDRGARAQLLNVFSSGRSFIQGLPQGFVLDPFLLLFFIDDLNFSFNDDVVIAHFADAVSILSTARKEEDAEAAA